MSSRIDATLEAMRAARANPSDEISRAYTTSTGLVGYDLEAPAKLLYPWGEGLTPIRNRIPRVAGGGGTATNWKAVTAVNTGATHPGVSEGARGGSVATTVTPFTAPYVSLGLEDSVTFEADEASKNFDDAKAKATLGLLRSFMLEEEKMLLGGNGSVDLGKPTTPTVVAADTGGALAAATYSVAVVPLTMYGLQRAVVGAAGVPQTISRANADGTTETLKGFCGTPSDAATGAVSGGAGGKLSCTVPAVRGAFGYAWFVGAAGAEKIVAITTINSVVITAAAAGANQALSALAAEDDSKDSAHNFTGLLYTAFTTGSGAYVKALATGTAGVGSKLTSDGKGGVVEINDAIAAIWDAYFFEPDEILCHRGDADDISKLILSATTGPLFRIDLGQEQGRADIAAGGRITKYISPITGKVIPIRIHRNAVRGTILLDTWELPYKLSGVENIVAVKTSREYHQIEWPLRTRKYEYGVYSRQLLAHYAPFSMGVLHNIAPQ